jgi:steroid delta-isomerase-like uncharacterized protein
MTPEELERLDDQGLATWNDHDPDGWVGLFADDFVLRDWAMAEPIRDREGARRYFNAWLTAFPDMQVKALNRVTGGDAVAAEVEFRGTNTGPMVMGDQEMPATNKAVVGTGVYFARYRDGKAIEFSAHPDVAGMMMQLGLMPGM